MLNIVILQGKLLKDVRATNTSDGTPIATFTIVNTREARDKNGGRVSDFIDIVAWKDLATFISDNFVKGDRIVIVGRLQRRLHITQDGERIKQIEVVAEKAYFSGKSNEFPFGMMSEEE